MSRPTDHTYTTPSGPVRGRPVIPTIPAIIVGVVVLGLIGGLVALIMLSNESGSPIKETPLVDILDNPGAYEGEEVVTAGTVDTILGERAFTLASLNTLVLVRGDGAMYQAATANNPIFLRGEVVKFDLESAREATSLDLPDETFAGYEGTTAFIADAISPTIEDVNGVEADVGGQ
jgi:hypothetical protein